MWTKSIKIVVMEMTRPTWYTLNSGQLERRPQIWVDNMEVKIVGVFSEKTITHIQQDQETMPSNPIKSSLVVPNMRRCISRES
jgi:hypothetical protein